MTAFGAVAASWLTLIVCLNALRWQLTSSGAITLGLVGLLGVLRPTMFVLGLDTPFPSDVFENRVIEPALVAAQLAVILWMVAFTLTARRASSTGRRTTLSRPPDNARIVKFVLPIAVLAVLLTIPFWLRYGGPSGLTTAAKERRISGAVRTIRIPGLVAAYLGTTVAMFKDPRTGERPWAVRGWIAYALGAAVSYSWGARDAAVFPLIVPLVIGAVRPRRMTWATFRRFIRSAPRAVTIFALVLGLGVGLRMWRDVTLTGAVQRTIADQTVARRVSVAMNLTQFDALMLVVEDVPTDLPFAGLDAVRQSASALVPVVSSSAAAFVPPAVEVAQHYEPKRKNGWPLTAAGDWYYALGYLGVVLGAAGSGWVAARIDSWQRRQAPHRGIATTALVVMWSTTIAVGGISLTTPSRIVSIGVPAFAAVLAIRTLPLRLAGGLGWVGHREVPLDAPSWWRSPSRLRAAERIGEFEVTIASMITGLVAALAVSVVAARALGPAGYGALSWVTGATYLGSAAAAFGLPLTVVAQRGVAKRSGDDAPHSDLQAIAVAAALGLLIGTLLFGIASVAPTLIGSEFAGAAKAAAFIIAPTAALAVASACLRADGRFLAAALTNEQTLRLVWLLGLAAALTVSSRSAAVVAAVAAAATIAWAIMAIRAITRAGEDQPSAISLRAPGMRRLLGESTPFFVGTIGATLIPQAGVLVLGLQRDANEVAVLGAAVRVQMLCSVVAIAATRVIGPRIARWRRPTDELSAMLRDASTFVFAATAVAVAPFMLAGRWTIPLLFGDGFEGAVTPTFILLVGLITNTFTGSSGQLLYNAGHQHWLAKRVLAGGLAFVVFSAALGPRFGATGVALSATGVVVVLNVAQTVAAVRKSNVRTWARVHPAELLPSCRRFLKQGVVP